jgi:hypothetical protein
MFENGYRENYPIGLQDTVIKNQTVHRMFKVYEFV